MTSARTHGGAPAAHDDLHPTDAALAVAVETGTGQLRLDLTRRLAAEALGTAILIVAVVGSGIAASRLSTGDVGLQLLENAAATACALIGLILMFGAVSGAHFNPVVTPLDRMLGTTTTRDTVLYVVAQVVGGCLGTMLAKDPYCEVYKAVFSRAESHSRSLLRRRSPGSPLTPRAPSGPARLSTMA